MASTAAKVTAIEASPAFADGVANLLQGCLNAQPGERLLIFHEAPGQNIYCDRLPIALAKQAEQFGLTAQLAQMPVVEDANSLGDAYFAPAKDVDHVVYLARCGDQMRFQAPPMQAQSAICYAVSGELMSSKFGRTPHALMLAVKDAVDAAFEQARHILIECPLGTRIEGYVDDVEQPSLHEVARFPQSVCRPISAATFSGKVVIPHFLVGTGSRYYSPFATELQAPLTVWIDRGDIVSFNGHAADVAAAQKLHTHLGERFNIAPNVVHSWHAGIHPGLEYDMPANANYERWSGVAVGNPRSLHFHACGDYAPGEISWNVIDPTVTVDGVKLWENGQMRPHFLPGYGILKQRYPEVTSLFSDPATHIGL